MQTLKPRCDACGTANAVDADYCQECGIRIIREKNEEGDLYWDPSDHTLNIQTDVDKIICKHVTTIQNIQCKCVRCNDCDKRFETCSEHILTFDYTLQTKKKKLLDHLRDEPIKKTPFSPDPKLDFESLQIPDWYFKDEVILCKYKDCIDTKPYHTYHYSQSKVKPVIQHVEEDEMKKPLFPWIKPPKKVDPIRDHVITKIPRQKPEPRQVSISGYKRPKIPSDEIKPHNYSLWWFIPISLWSLWIILFIYFYL